MNCLNWCARAALLLGVAAGLPAAHADTLNFDDPALANLYEPYVDIPIGDYLLNFQFDGGLIGTAGDLQPETAPLGNNTQFLTALNTGYFTLQRADGAEFDLLSFDLAFVPQPNSPPVPSMVFLMRADNDATVAVVVDNTVGSHPFETFNDAAQLAGLGHTKQVSFGFCSYNPDTHSVCELTLGAAGQFSMDNIVLQPSAVPELPALLLMAVGMTGVFARSRKTTRTSAK